MRLRCPRGTSVLYVLTLFTLLAPGRTWGALPTTVEGQAEFLADRYAQSLELLSEALPVESIQASRAELAQGLRSLIAQALTRQQVRELDQWMVTNAVPAGELTPPELELHNWVGLTLDAVRAYLSRPALTPELHRGVMAQAGIVFDALRQELAAQFRGVISEVEMKVAGVVFGDTFLVSAAATSPVSPFMKRLFTPAEMEMLLQYARGIAVTARRDWDDSVASVAEEKRAAWAASLQARSVYLRGAAAQMQYQILASSYTQPLMLTPEEYQALHDAYVAQRAAAAAAETGGN